MLEWDAGSFNRKFANTITMFKHMKTGRLASYMCLEYSGNYFIVNTVDGVDRQQLHLNQWEPEYHHIPTGWIMPFTLVYRKNHQSYHVGMSPQNFSVCVWDKFRKRLSVREDITEEPWTSMVLENLPLPVTEDEKALSLRTIGRISQEFFLGPDKLYYYAIPVGEREGNKLRLLAPIEQEISDILRGHEWQKI